MTGRYPRAASRAVRLVAILERLRAGEEVLASAAAEMFGCSQRSLERDILVLQQPPFSLRIVREGWAWRLDHPTPGGDMGQEEANKGEYQVPLEVYDQLEGATPDERANIVLRLIEEHPKHRLELPERDGRRADLSLVDFSSPVQRDHLRSANLQRAYLMGANLQGAFLWNANLQGAFLVDTNLQGAGLRHANIQGANLWWADLQGASLSDANLQGADLRGTRLQGVDLSTCDLTHILISGAWLDRTRLQWEQLGGAIGEELKAEDRKLSTAGRARRYGEAKWGYLVLKQNFDDLGDYDASSRAYRKERRMEKLEAYQSARAAFHERKLWTALAQGAKVAGDLFVEVLCDYGESIGRVIAWMLALILVVGPALVVLLGGLYWMGDNQSVYSRLTTPWQRGLYAYVQYVLYILDAFTTAGFAELKPVNDFVRLVSGLIALSGIVLAGLLGFVAGNRIRRS